MEGKMKDRYAILGTSGAGYGDLVNEGIKINTKSGSDKEDSSDSSFSLTGAQKAQLTIENAGAAIGNVINFIGNYKAAKKNYAITQQNAAELIDQTNRQVALLQKQWAEQDAVNQLFIANSGLNSSSFSDVERYSLQQVEQEGQDMRTYARRKATEMIRQARAAKNEAKKKQNAGLAGTLLGAGAGVAIGAVTGGPTGAIIGGTTGANLGGQLGYGLGGL